MKQKSVVLFIFSFLLLHGCKTEHKVELEVKPMQITIDVNIRIDRELDSFFGNLDEAAKALGKGSGNTKTTETSNPGQ